ncbi:phosphate ABC transporter permease PstA [Amedibacillus dolichus]|uniref:Phosphate transport system permease protein PstA n=1 Tax=Amedibacillus dolichus TaxID=31971 RepID=A0ABT7UAJ7_9FIRM|nr:phosphate ABC transporter permease PstA [Amedibacillus dolichus]MDM8156665.1 phosphate ABC transporter permease PstA [Amedibacillus dolichus]
MKIKTGNQNKRRFYDGILQALTYLSSGISVLVLAALFVFIFSRGWSSINMDLLTNNYWSENYNVEPVSEVADTTFERPADLSEEAYFSEKWGVAFVDHVNAHKEEMILVEYIDENSPLYAMSDVSIRSNPQDFTMQVGMQVSRLSYTNEQGDTQLAGIGGQTAQDVAQALDQATSVNSMFIQTTGGGIRGSIISTCYLLLVSLVIAIPVGVASAIYLNEYARKSKFNMMLRSGIETLTGVPSIVFGLMGVTVLFPVTQLFGATTTSILLGGLTMSIILLPTIIRSTEEALLVVPQHLRDASLSVGANQSQTIFKIVLPCAVPGILTGVLLGIGRVIGESAALIYTMGTFINDSPTLLSQGTSLAVQIWSIMSGEQPNYELACAISIIILFFVLILNFAVKIISKRFSKAWY